MRLFIAIQFDDSILDELTNFQEDLKRQGVTGNYSARENLHITLAFIGNYPNPGEVLDVIEQVDFRPIEITIQGVGRFGNLFWVGLAKNKQLESYVRRLRRELANQGIPFDKKRFSPHITLIRKYNYKGGDMIPVSNPPKGRMRATHISLMKSERGKNGMIYTDIREGK